MKYYLLIQLLSNSYLCSVILITQFITYPSFYNIDKETFIHHHKKYVDSISLIVAPVMLVELFSLIMIVDNKTLNAFIDDSSPLITFLRTL